VRPPNALYIRKPNPDRGLRSCEAGRPEAKAGAGSATLSNQALLHRLQPKLTIGPVNDPLEHEADVVAEIVMGSPRSRRARRRYRPLANARRATRRRRKFKQSARAGTLAEARRRSW